MVQSKLREFAGVNSSVETFLTERIEETLSGYTAAVAVNVFGNDLDMLDREAQEVATQTGQDSRRDGRTAPITTRNASSGGQAPKAGSGALGF